MRATSRARAGAVAGLALPLSLALGGCGAAGPAPAASGAALPTLSPPPAVLDHVPAGTHVDAARAAASWIGPGGGSLTAVAPDGTEYLLDIPEASVAVPTAITMAPVTAIDNLGLGGGLLGAVVLEPASLKLAAPATLHIRAASTAPAGTRLVGFDAAGDGQGPQLLPAVPGDREAAVTLFHFSAPGAGFGTRQDLQRFAAPAATGRLASVLSHLLSFDAPWSATDRAAAYGLILLAWSQVLEPELNTVANDRALLEALADWRQFVFLLNLFLRSGDAAAAVADGLTVSGAFPVLLDLRGPFIAGQDLVGRRLRDALDGNKALCNQAHDLAALANVWFWARVGVRYHETFLSWLDEARGCADIAITTANLPGALQPGGVDSIDLQFALAFSDGTRVPADVDADMRGSGFTFVRGSAASLATGVRGGYTLTEGVSAQAPPPYGLSVHACWRLDGLLRGLCTDFALPFGSAASGPPVPTAAQPSGAAYDISGTYHISVTCNFVDYGTGTGQLTQSGAAVSMSWTVGLAPDRDVATADSLCWGPYIQDLMPVGGTFSGTLATAPSGAMQIEFGSVTLDPCRSQSGGAASPSLYSMRRFYLPFGACGLRAPVLYTASWTGP